MPERLENLAERYFRLWRAVYVLLVVALVALALYTLTVSFWRGPWRDMWEAMPFIEKAMAGQATLADYWEQYGYSHRPLVSRWLWLADFRWFAGSNHLLLAVSLIMQLQVFFSVWAVLRRDNSFTAGQRCIVLGSALFCLCNITQVFNFLHTFDVQWFLVTGFVVLSLERILVGVEQIKATHQKDPQLIMAWLCVWVASLNNFSALVIWPVEVLLLVALRYPVTRIAGFSCATVIYLLVYFHGLPAGDNALLGEMQQQGWSARLHILAWILVVFPLYYLSNPLSFQLASDGPLHLQGFVTGLAPSLAAILLLFAAWHWWQGLAGRRVWSAVAWMGLALILYGYGVGVVTALGRAIFWDNVYALRYQNIVLLFWIGVVLWLASSVRLRHLGLLAGAGLLLLVYTFNMSWNYENILRTGNRTRDAHLAIKVGLENELSAIQATVSRSHLGKDSNYNLQHEAQFLRDIAAGPYADPAWQVPDFAVLQTAGNCVVPATDFSVHGSDGSYARLAIDFAEPVTFSLVAWFDSDRSAPGLLIAERADDLAGRMRQTVTGFVSYAGFARQLPQQKPAQVFARAGEHWCRLVFSTAGDP